MNFGKNYKRNIKSCIVNPWIYYQSRRNITKTIKNAFKSAESWIK